MPVCCPALTRLPSSMRRKPGAARDRGADGRIVELRPRGVDRRGVGGDRGGQLQHHGVLRVQLLLGGEVLLGERGEASEIELRVGEIGLVLRFLGDGLVERGLKRSGVDLGQKIALLDHLAFVKADLHDLAVDTGAHENGVVGLDLSNALENDREIRALDRRHGDDDRRGAGRLTRLTLARRRCGLSGRASRSCRAAGGRARRPPEANGPPSLARKRHRRRQPRTPIWPSTRTGRISWSEAFLQPSEPRRRTAFTRGRTAARAAPDSQHASAFRRRFSREIRQYHPFGRRGASSTKFDRRAFHLPVRVRRA